MIISAAYLMINLLVLRRPELAQINLILKSPKPKQKYRQMKHFHFRSSSPSKPQTPISRIPIRTANAEKRARDQGLVQDIDETRLSPSELRALR